MKYIDESDKDTKGYVNKLVIFIINILTKNHFSVMIMMILYASVECIRTFRHFLTLILHRQVIETIPPW